jgi:hypothetical protein
MLKALLWIIGILLGLMGYVATAHVAFDYLGGSEKLAAHQECMSSPRLLCSHLAADDEGLAAAFWPVAIPAVFAYRHYIFLLKTALIAAISSAIGVGCTVGVVRFQNYRRRRQEETAKNSKRKLREAEELIRREAPELLAVSELD